MSVDFDVVVVGGGLAGLAAGATASAGGASTVVLEAHRPGGRARVTERGSFVFNLGVHALFTGGPGAAALEALGIRLGGRPPAMDDYVMLADGHQHVLPVSPESVERTDYFDRIDKTQFVALAGRMAQLDPMTLEGLSVRDWLASQELRPRVEAVVRALFRLSTYAADLDQFGADAALAQQQVAARGGVIYVDNGWAQLVGALQSRTNLRTGVAVRGIAADARGAAVVTDEGTFTARAVIVAVGTPSAAQALLPDARWGALGDPITAACLDVGTRRVPTPGYVVGIDSPLYGTVQSPPARQAPPGHAVVGVIRYGARRVEQDRPDLEAHLSEMGVRSDDIVVRRLLARMIVSGAMPAAATGGLAGRPSVTATGVPRVFLAGDWVGRDGVLSDAALASGHVAARAALRVSEHATRVA